MKSNPPNPSVIYLKIFLIIFLLITIGTVITRLYQLFQDKTFDSGFYSVLILGEKKAEILSFVDSGDNIKVARLHIEDVDQNLAQYSLFEKSIMLGVPLSAVVETEKSGSELFGFSNMLAHLLGKKENSSERIGDIDYLFLYSKHIQNGKDNVIEKKVLYNDLRERLVDPTELSELFKSDMILGQKLSISVINSSGKSGVAKRVSDMLEVTGYYVISIDSADLQDGTEIFTDREESQFLFPYLFGVVPQVSQKNSLEDVKIIIGRNSVKNL